MLLNDPVGNLSFLQKKKSVIWIDNLSELQALHRPEDFMERE